MDRQEGNGIVDLARFSFKVFLLWGQSNISTLSKEETVLRTRLILSEGSRSEKAKRL